MTATKNNPLDRISTKTLSCVVAMVALLLASPAAFAQNLYWDVNGASAGSGGPSPSGTWDGTTANWNTSLDGTNATSIWGSGANAIFSAGNDVTGSYTITLSGTQTASGVSFEEGNITLTDGALNLTGISSISVNASPVKGTIASPITGSRGLTKTLSGELVLQGTNTFTGNLTNKAGTVTLENSQAAGSRSIVMNPSTSPAILHSSKPLTLTNNISLLGITGSLELNADDSMILSGVISGPHNWSANGTGVLTLAGVNTFAGVLTVSQGTLVVTSDQALGSVGGGTVVNNGATLAFDGGFEYAAAEHITLNGTGVNGGGAMNNLTGDNYFDGQTILAANSSIGVQSGGSLALLGSVTGNNFDLTKVGPGTLFLTSDFNSYSNTTVSEGTLSVQSPSTAGSGLVTISPNAVLEADGNAAPGGISVSGIVSPGAGMPVTLASGSEIWNGGGIYDWSVNDAQGTAGNNPGWSLLNITGTLTINADSANPFIIRLSSMDPSYSVPGYAIFDSAQIYTWTIATASGGILGFDQSKFIIDTNGFFNELGNGAFAVQQVGNSVVLRFVQKPQIVANPISQNANACDDVTFSVSATGTELHYQWLQGVTPVGTDSSTFTPDIPAAGILNYSVIVSNISCYAVTSSVATLTVVDPLPVIHGALTDITNYTTDCDKVITWTEPTVTDNCPGATIVSDHPSTTFPVGKTVVTYIATDSNSQTATNRFTVTVIRNSTTVIDASAPITYGDSVTFTARVDACSIPPTGTVTFKDNGITLGTATLNSAGVATYTAAALIGGTHNITAEYAGDSYYTASTSSALSQVVNKATPTLSVNNSPVTYNASAQTATVSHSVPGSVSNVKYDAAAAAPTTAGTYAITADFTPVDTTNYNSLSDAPAGNFTINRATPTLSVNNSPVIFNGSAQSATVNPSVVGSVSNIKYNGSATVPTAAGTYAITADFAPTDPADYNSLTDASAGNFTINLATPSWTYGEVAFVYNSAAQGPSISFSGSTATPTTEYFGTNFDGTVYMNVTAPTNAGVYYVSNTVAADGNYNGATNSQAFTIAQATNTLLLTSSTNTSTYGDSVTFTVAVQTNGVTAADATSNIVFSVDSIAVATNALVAGEATYITSALLAGDRNVTVTYTGDNNYTNDATATLTQTVDKATPVVTVTDTTTFTYNGNPQGPATADTGGSSATATFSYSGTPNAGGTYGPSSTAPTLAGSYTVIASVVADNNYNAADSSVTGFTIDKATPVVTVMGITAFTYNNTPQGPATATTGGSSASATFSYSGTANGGGTYAPSATAPTLAGSYTVTASVGADDNYNAADSSATAFTIGKATPVVTVTGITAFTYNNTPQGPATATTGGSSASPTFSYSGTPNGGGSYGPSATAPTLAGSYTVTASVVTDDNYAAASSVATAFTIDKETPVVAVTGATTFTYNGNPQGPATATTGGSSASATFSYSGTPNGGGSYGPSATAPTLAGSYTVIASVVADNNYTAASSSATVFTIDKATPSWTYGGEVAFVYNGAAQGPSITFSGSTATSTTEYVGTNFDGTAYVNVMAPTNAGVYYVSNTVATDGNFNGATNSLAFSIAQATNTLLLTSSSTGDTSTYGDSVTFTAAVQTNGVTAADATSNIVFSVDSIAVATNALVNGEATYITSALLAGDRNITVTYTGDNNYTNDATAALTQTVDKATPVVTVTDATTFTYNGNPQGPATATTGGSSAAATFSYSGTANGGGSYGPSATAPTLAGSYTVIASVVSDSNYTAADSAATAFTIDRATPTVAVTGTTTFTYNGNPQGPATANTGGSSATATFSYGGMPNGGGSYGPSATAPTLAGSYTVTASVAADDNYNAANSSATAFTIDKATPVVAVTGVTTFTYNGNPQGPATANTGGSSATATFSYGGTPNGGGSYGPSATAPTLAGSYTVTASVAADNNYNAANSSATAFTIDKATPVVAVTGVTTFTYNGNPQGPATANTGGSSASATFSYSGTPNGGGSYGPSATAPTLAGSYTVIASVVSDNNYTAADSAATAFTIDKATQSWTYGGEVAFVYNGAAQGPSISFSGSTATPTTEYFGTNFDGTVYMNLSAPTNAGVYYVSNTVASDGNYDGATNSLAFTIAQATNTLSLTSSSVGNTSTYGDSVTFTVAVQTNGVTAMDATSNIVFSVDNVAVATNALVNGEATYITSALLAGDRNVTVTYTGDNNYTNDATAALPQTVNKATPLICGVDPSQTISYGTDNVMLTGLLTTGGVYPPDGSVVSVTIDGSTQTAVTSGSVFVVNFPTAAIPASGVPYTITYAYLGDGNFNAATNSVTALMVNKATPAFSGVTASKAIAYGTASVTLGGTVSAGGVNPPDGSVVSVTINSSTQTAPVSGGAFSVNFPTAAIPASGAPYTITYSYGGNTNFNAAADDATTTLAVSSAVTAITGVTASQSITYGTPGVTLVGSVSANGVDLPAGSTIDVTINGSTLPATVSGSGFSVDFPTATIPASATPYPITYAYSGNANFSSAANSNTTLTVNKANLTVKADDAIRVYGTTNPVFTGTITGLMNHETVTASYTSTADINTPAGTNAITPAVDAAGLNGNYNVILVDGTLIITANLVLTPTPGHYTVADWSTEVDTAGQVLDGGSLNYNGGTLTVSVVTNASTDDMLQIEPLDGSSISVNSNSVAFNGVTFGTFSGGEGIDPLVIQFNTNATSVELTALIHELTFATIDESSKLRQIQLELAYGEVTVTAQRAFILNRPPVANDDTLLVKSGMTVTIPFGDLLANDTDADNDQIRLVGASRITVQGGRLILNSKNLVYTPPANDVDQDTFAYTVADSNGATSIGMVTIIFVKPFMIDVGTDSSKHMMIRMGGIPGVAYRLDASDDLQSWTPVTTVTCSSYGAIQAVDPGAMDKPKRFYRVVALF